MTQRVSELLSSALRLSPSERQELADCLWASLDQDDPYAAMSEDEFIAELDRRSAELKADPAAGIPWVRMLQELFTGWTEEDAQLTDEEADRLRNALEQDRRPRLRSPILD